MNRLALMSKLLSVDKKQKVSLSFLRKRLEELKPSEERELAKDLLAYAHLACFNMDGREIIHAINYWDDIGNNRMLTEVLRITKLYGHFKAVNQIRKIGLEKGLKDLQVPNFTDWFKSWGIKWFDMYVDHGKNIAFIKEDDIELISKLISIPWKKFWADVLEEIRQAERLSLERKQLLFKLANRKDPVIHIMSNMRESVNQKFRNYCDREGIQIIKVLQDGIEGVDRCSWVYLVLDSDGIFKIYKELLDNKKGRLGNVLNNEDEIFVHLPNADFLPRYYGTVSIDGNLRFIKQSVHFSQSLADYIKKDNLLNIDQACQVILGFAEKLKWLHKENVLYLDIKPENILLDSNDVRIIDFGISKLTKPEQDDSDIFLAEPQYVTPEGGTSLRASFSSDVFQLGVLFHQLLTGKHPFAIDIPIEKGDREGETLKYSWPNIVLPYTHNLSKEFDDKRLAIINRMLKKEQSKRPTLDEIINSLKDSSCNVFPIIQRRRGVKNKKERNTVLFPARMGLPHKGHIEYINRLLELGFFTIISIQRSYTITDQDPIPKWLVMKILANSLFDKGWSREDFDFILTPFYRTDQEHGMHFAMMPRIEDVVGIASSNPSVHKLFKRFQILNQRSVFGVEGKKYIDLSWGRRLREAVKENDYASFLSLAATGTEKIIPFHQIRDIYGKPNIEFVDGEVKATLLDEKGQTVVQGNVFRYSSPEKSLIRHLSRLGVECEMLNPYSRLTEVLIDGKKNFLKYLKTEFQEGNELIFFQYA